MPKIVRMNLLRRYPIAFTLMALVIVSALAPLPPLVDAVTGAPPYDVDLVRPATYTLLAPLSDVLDALTFLSMGRAWWFLLVWVIGLAVWGVARSGSRPRPLRQRVWHFLYIDVGWIPSGRRAPEVTEPAEHPDARAVERQLRDGVTRFLALARELLPARRADLFVRHPVFGDLTLPEWLRFHVRHCAHHAKQIRARLAS